MEETHESQMWLHSTTGKVTLVVIAVCVVSVLIAVSQNPSEQFFGGSPGPDVSERMKEQDVLGALTAPESVAVNPSKDVLKSLTPPAKGKSAQASPDVMQSLTPPNP